VVQPTNDGSVWAAGLNSNGQLGIGSTSNSSTPLWVGSLTGVTAIDAGATHSLFLTDNGSVWAAGRNANGQLGDGTIVTPRTLPVITVNVSPCGRTRQPKQPEEIVVKELELIKAFPNPADAELVIDLTDGPAQEVSPVFLFDNFGKTLIQDQFNPGESTKSLVVRDLPSGVYLIRVKTPGGPASKKIVILH
jgi:Secretion system C-terminal sorting domain/Regulator of chromosome condensation (RCC1) repeat